MKSYEASAFIKAPPEAVWAILTDAPGLSRWDSGIERVEGRIAPGETIKVFVKVNPGRAFPVKVIEFEPGQRMVWSGGMPLGLFKGARTYTLAQATGRSRPLADRMRRSARTGQASAARRACSTRLAGTSPARMIG